MNLNFLFNGWNIALKCRNCFLDRLSISALVVLVGQAGCASHNPVPSISKPDTAVKKEQPAKKGRYSLLEDQGPEVDIEVANIPDAIPKKEQRTIAGNLSPYTVLGKTYYVQPNAAKYSEVGLASWYGKKFHGERTSNGEIYNMFAMTAAHKTLPIPCYVRVTNLSNNKNVLLRVNDRGPFHEDRVIDLTYTAAKKLDFHRAGTTKVRVEIMNMGDFIPMSIAAVKTDSGNKLIGALAQEATGAQYPDSTKTASIGAVKSNEASNSIKPGMTAAKNSAIKPVETAMAPAYLQVGAFASQGGALALQQNLKAYTKLPIVLMPVADRKIFRVLIGPITDATELQGLKTLLTDKKLSTPYLVEAANVK
jgi:rare lipoprotein A